MILCTYVIWFVLYSFLGWIFETVYCSIHESKWENRGFLYGPLCPIYGFGGVGISFVFQHMDMFGATSLTNVQLFLIGYLGSIVLEYSTSWILEKLFHAVWWDYSNMPLNVNGRICLPASILFGLASILVVRVIFPIAAQMTTGLSSFSPLISEALALGMMGLLGGDTALTISALTNFEKELQEMENNINQHMALFVNSIAEKTLDAQILIEDERSRFSRENIAGMTRRLGNSRVGALKRIKHFSPKALPEKSFNQMSRVLDAIKNSSRIIEKVRRS